MNGLPPDPNATIDPSADAAVETLCQKFEAAWQQALLGSARPAVEGFLARVSDAERPSLRAALARIDEEYRQRMARLCSIEAVGLLNADDSAEVADPPPPSGGTVIYTDPTAEIGQATEDTAHHATDGTSGLGPAPTDATVTIDPAPADPGATLDPGEAAVPAVKAGARRAGPDGPAVAGYDILGLLGRGGMGVVYKARHQKLKRLVALKMVLAGAHAGPQELGRFFIEAEAIAQLQHPNIVQVYEIGEQDGLPYLALEFVDGGSLNARLDGKPVPARDAARLAETLARAMGYAHLHGVVHRDLKPANVLVTADGQPKITDFGLAKRLEGDSGQTKSGTLMGTPAYMAPEQARGDIKVVGPLADVYSLGVILYQMLTGRTPFIGTSVIDTLHQVEHLEPVPPSRLQPSVPADLETVTLKCLQKDPGKRYASADALADDLRRFLAGEPILARPVGRAERLWRWCRRNPRVAALSAAVLALLVAVAVTSTAMAIRISREHAAAVEARDLAAQKAADEAAARERADHNAAAEKVAREEADKQAALALKTLQSLIVEVVQAKLGEEPRTQRLKLGLLQTALNGLEQASPRAESLTGTSIKATVASAYINMGFVLKQLGETEEAFKYFSRGHEIVEARAKAQPNRDAAKGNLAATFTLLGDMSQELRRDMTAALGYYRKALELREQLYLHPHGGEGKIDPVAVKQALAEAHTRVAVTVLRLGDPAGSLESFRKALALREEMAAAAPANEAMQQDLARTYNAVGEISFLSRDPAAARTYYEKCLQVREALHRAKPDSPRHKRELAAACGNFGDVHVRSGDPEAARRQYDRALTLCRELANADPQNVDFRRDLGVALYRLGTLCQSIHDAAGAEKYYGECARIREDLAAKDPKNNLRQVELMRILPHVGRHARAAAIAEKLRATTAPDTELLFEIGCGYALCADGVAPGKDAGELSAEDRALRQRYAAAAVAALADAVARGYTDAVTLEVEPDLQFLRGDPTFQELLTKVRAAAGARAATRARP
jgi:serine/threonine-protein kinase